MATITPTMNMLERGTLITWTWTGLHLNDTGDQVEWSRLADRSVHIYGTWGGATVIMEGSNDGSNFVTLDDLTGTAISKTGDSLFGILQIAAYIRPRVIGGDGTTNLTAIMLSRR